MKRFKRSDTNDIFITDYTSVKKVQAQFVTIATILNEKDKNNITDVKVLIYILMPIEPSIKDPSLKLRTAKLSDNTGNIQITVFATLMLCCLHI